MARLNTNLSATPQPQPARSATVDSLYRDPTPLSQVSRGTRRESSYSVMSPALSQSSDKENNQPESRENTPDPSTKGLGSKHRGAPRLPTPSSGSSSSRHANKRRRVEEYSVSGSTHIYVDPDVDVDGQDVVDDEEDEDEDEATGSTAPITDEDDELTKYYDPQQDPEQRRAARINIRNTHRNLEGQCLVPYDITHTNWRQTIAMNISNLITMASSTL